MSDESMVERTPEGGPSRDERLRELLRSLAQEASSVADGLRTDDRPDRLGWGIMALNGWMDDIRKEAARRRDPAPRDGGPV